MVCFVCGGETIEVRPNFYKCVFCGTYQEFTREGIPRIATLKSYPYTETIKEAAVEGAMQIEHTVLSNMNLDPDIVAFIQRLSEALTPLEGFDRAARVRALDIRRRFKQELVDVFEGRKEWQAWYDATRTMLGMHTRDFMVIIYKCLEGLESEEAVDMRDAYAKMISGGVV